MGTRPRERFKQVPYKMSSARARDRRPIHFHHARTRIDVMSSWDTAEAEPAICALFVCLPSCANRRGLLGCCLRRARSASRSKPSRAAQPARGRSVDSVDESATGSANSWSRTAGEIGAVEARTRNRRTASVPGRGPWSSAPVSRGPTSAGGRRHIVGAHDRSRGARPLGTQPPRAVRQPPSRPACGVDDGGARG